MRILITQAQFLLGGTETYAVTVAEQLERLGHPTRIHAGKTSDAGRELVASRGLRLTVGPPAALAEVDDVDAVIAQDAAAAYALASRRSDLSQLFVIHGFAGFEHPPGALDPPPRVVVLNDRTAAHAAALASRPEIERLRQPIDIERFRPRGPARPRAERVLVLSNYLPEDRLAIIRRVCDELGLELTRLGVGGEERVDPPVAIAAADIVVGYGRSVLEGLAMGRAAYVWDHGGGDGWITAESYPRLEASGFSGAATDLVVDVERLRADFAAYRPELGAYGFDLVRRHHTASRHAEELVGLLDKASAPRAADANQTISLLIRAEARAASRAEGLEAEARRAIEEYLRRREHAEDAEAALVREREARQAAEARLAEVLGSRSWRALEPARRLGTRLRGGRP